MKLIINADDFGMGINKSQGILLLDQAKKINSVSICVNSIEPILSVYKNSQKLLNCTLGLHLNLSEGRALSRERDYFLAPLRSFRRAEQLLVHEKMLSVSAIETEIRAQLALYREIFGNLPSHMDSHQHFAYLSPKAFEAFLRVSADYEIPIRSPNVFLNSERLYYFLRSLRVRYGINLPLCVTSHIKKLKSLIERYGLISRTDDCLIDFDFCSMNTKLGLRKILNRTGSLEILCHPSLDSNSRPCVETAAILSSGFKLD